MIIDFRECHGQAQYRYPTLVYKDFDTYEIWQTPPRRNPLCSSSFLFFILLTLCRKVFRPLLLDRGRMNFYYTI